MTTGDRTARCTIVPPYLLRSLEEHGAAEVAACARRTLAADASLRAGGRLPALRAATGARTATTDGAATPDRLLSDAAGGMELPGAPARAEGEPPTGETAVDQAYDGLGATWELLFGAFGRDSLDGSGMRMLATVHYGESYDNAFWDGTQMVFGDGDGEIFTGFTGAVDVIGHELAHGVIELTAGLVYAGQSGALNESVADVIGSLVKQRVLGQTAEEADWLVGSGLFTDAVQGVALRSLAAPGTAYDDDVLGRDPQPATMAGYVETTDDNGGVHINSGIPNHAFYLAATAIGGHAWEAPGQIWYDALTGSLPSGADFATFAGATLGAAVTRFGEGSREAEAVASAWQQVGLPVPAIPVGAAGSGGTADAVAADATEAPSPPLPPPGAEAVLVTVRRTGGFAGMTRESAFRPTELGIADATRWSALLASGLLPTLAGEEPAPDRFTYQVVAVERQVDVRFSDTHLPADVRDLLDRALRHSGGEA